MTANSKLFASGGLLRAWRFLRKPLYDKSQSFYARWSRLFPNIPGPVLLPFGAWWLVRNDFSGYVIRHRYVESAELAFVEQFLQPGMTVLDLGAHHGLYTLLASKGVGRKGRVISFEPSPRERRALRLHVWLNLCRNVTIEEFALGDQDRAATLYVVEGADTGCNSLRPPIVVSKTSAVHVQVRRLDGWLKSQGIEHVDFIKLDVEGGELAALKGAAEMLGVRPRPIILAEVQDVRTRPWGYAARDILQYLCDRGYKWFSLLKDGSVQELDLSPDEFEGNFVACPEESLSKLERAKLKPEGPQRCPQPLSQ